MNDTNSQTNETQPTNELAQMIYRLMTTSQLFFEHDHAHAYIGQCQSKTGQPVTIQLDCREASCTIDGKVHKLSREDANILCQEIAKQASLRLAAVRANDLDKLRKLAEITN
jgi:hypothetical protein